MDLQTIGMHDLSKRVPFDINKFCAKFQADETTLSLPTPRVEVCGMFLYGKKRIFCKKVVLFSSISEFHCISDWRECSNFIRGYNIDNGI